MAWSKIYSLSQHECMHAATCTVVRKHTLIHIHTHALILMLMHSFTHSCMFMSVIMHYSSHHVREHAHLHTYTCTYMSACIRGRIYVRMNTFMHI